jgi:hypothetical protein
MANAAPKACMEQLSLYGLQHLFWDLLVYNLAVGLESASYELSHRKEV